MVRVEVFFLIVNKACKHLWPGINGLFFLRLFVEIKQKLRNLALRSCLPLKLQSALYTMVGSSWGTNLNPSTTKIVLKLNSTNQ